MAWRHFHGLYRVLDEGKEETAQPSESRPIPHGIYLVLHPQILHPAI